MNTINQPSTRTCAPKWYDVPDEKWFDWRWQLAHRLNSADELGEVIHLTDSEKQALEAKGLFRVDITPYFASLIDPGYIDMAGWYPPGTLGGCCDNDVHEIFKCMGEIALDSGYVVENADGTLETWNCTAQRSERDGISVTPSEPVVSRVHFNLRKPSRVTVNFATGEQRGTITTMGWFGPGGLQQELR